MKETTASLPYRRDLDGLRALAILLVLGYHVAPTVFPGGFVGVDVFFVISGFLITRILVADAAPDRRRGRFRRFYARRARRLAPALLLVLTATLALGWSTLLPEALRELGEHTVAAALFVANIAFWLESGYFDAGAIEKPLLHLWSLGIEEQFYLVWPVTLWWLIRDRGPSLARARGVSLAIALVSFAACVAVVGRSPQGAFYLPWFRFWEFLAGGLLALWADPADPLRIEKRAEVPAWLGLTAVVASAFWLGRPGSSFPSWTALVPVLGTAMLIAGGGRTSLARTLFSWRPVVWLGLVSYPLYLWHWPLISLLADGRPVEGIASRAQAAAIALLLAALTYLFAEQPTRMLYRRHPRATIAALVSAMALVTAVALVPWLGGEEVRAAPSPKHAQVIAATELDERLRASLQTRPCEAGGAMPTAVRPSCRVSGPATGDRRPLLLWGDSTAESWAPLVHAVAADRDQAAVVLSLSGCPPLLGVRAPLNESCDLDDEEWKRSFVEELRPSHIVLSARWAAYVEETPGSRRSDEHFVTAEATGNADLASSREAVSRALPRTLEWLVEIAPVVVIAAPPDLTEKLRRAIPLGLEYRPRRVEHERRQQRVRDLLDEISALEPRVTVLDPAERLCSEDPCLGIVQDTIVYLDDNHVTAQGALLFRDELAAALESGKHGERSLPAGAD